MHILIYLTLSTRLRIAIVKTLMLFSLKLNTVFLRLISNNENYCDLYPLHQAITGSEFDLQNAHLYVHNQSAHA